MHARWALYARCALHRMCAACLLAQRDERPAITLARLLLGTHGRARLHLREDAQQVLDLRSACMHARTHARTQRRAACNAQHVYGECARRARHCVG